MNMERSENMLKDIATMQDSHDESQICLKKKTAIKTVVLHFISKANFFLLNICKNTLFETFYNCKDSILLKDNPYI